MNNAIKILLIILLVAIIGALVAFMVFVMKGSFNFSIFGFGESTTLIEEKEFDEVKNIKVDVKTANVYFKHSTNDKVKVEIYSDNAKEHSIKLDDDLNLTVFLDDERVFFMSKSPRIIITLPSTFTNKIEVSSTTGDISSEDLESADFDIHVTTGDVKFGKTNNAKVKCTTGDINIGLVNDLVIDVTTGDIEIGSINRHLDINTTTGDIRIDSINITENSSISTTTGDVRISKKNDIYVDADAKTGDVKVSDNNRHSENELKIRTKTGDIKVG